MVSLLALFLETIILIRQNFAFYLALKTATGMSLISMISMEVAMNTTDYFLTGGGNLNMVGNPNYVICWFVTPWPYNYWRLKKFNEACH